MRLTSLHTYWLSHLEAPLNAADQARLVMFERHLTDALELRLVRRALELAPSPSVSHSPPPTREEDSRRAEQAAYGAQRLAVAKEIESRRQELLRASQGMTRPQGDSRKLKGATTHTDVK